MVRFELTIGSYHKYYFSDASDVVDYGKSKTYSFPERS
jgi:hypothetical protein